MPKFSLDNKVVFHEEEHKYFNVQTNEEYISVSKLIHNYTPEFDPTGEILIASAKKHGVPPEDLKQTWLNKKNTAATNGTNLHASVEHWVKNRKIIKNEYSDLVKKISKVKFKGKLMSETILVHHEYKIAGTLDLIDEYGDFEADIWDLKTNEKLKDKSFFRRGMGYEKLLYPINYLMNCNKVIYSLQQQIYCLLLEQAGYWVNDQYLLHVNLQDRTITKHEVLPLRNEAKKIIQHHFSTTKT